MKDKREHQRQEDQASSSTHGHTSIVAISVKRVPDREEQQVVPHARKEIIEESNLECLPECSVAAEASEI